MKKIGIIGGLAWPSTADYYRLICKRANEYFKANGAELPYATPPMVIESLDISQTRAARGVDGDENSWEAYDCIFRDTFNRLKAAGAEVAFIASNTPHMRLHSIQQGLDVPVISILDTTAKAVATAGGSRGLILGTPVTMNSDVYPMTLGRHGLAALERPSVEDIECLHHLIDVELYQGRVEGTADKLINISQHYVKDPSTDIVCLACTELPLAFPEFTDTAIFESAGLTFVNTIAAHVDAVLKVALN